MTDTNPLDSPYVGLRPFLGADSLFFFGRRAQTTELLDILHSTHFLTVVGSSGCGKSSLIRAGMIPLLKGGFLVHDRDRWLIARAKPGEAPLWNLASALAFSGEASPTHETIASLAGKIRDGDVDAVLDYLEPLLGDRSNLLLLVDQFEEIFAFRGTESDEFAVDMSPSQRRARSLRRAEAADFVDILLRLAERRDLPIYIVLTMRTDFLGDCDLFYGLPESMNRGRYLVPRLGRQQLREAIEGPALLMRAQIAPRLLDLLLNELGDRFDRLPVLQHALLRTWDRWVEAGGLGPIDFEHFEAAGALDGALSLDAELALEGLDLTLASKVFKRLTDTDSNHRRTRRPTRMSELVSSTGAPRESIEAIIGRFEGDGRSFLYRTDDGVPEDPRIDISHESLIRQWDRLRDWVDAERESRDQFLDLVKRAKKHADGEAALLQGPDLATAILWKEETGPTSHWGQEYAVPESDFVAAMAYLESSRATTESTARKRRQRRARTLAVAGVAAIVFGVLAIAAQLAANTARAEGARAENATRMAVAEGLAATDPTRAALVLSEIDAPERLRSAAALMQRVAGAPIAEAELRGHTGPVVHAAYMPDGSTIVSGSDDGSVRLWPGSGAGEPVVLLGPTEVVAVAVNRNGSLIAVGGRDGSVRLWNGDGSGSPRELDGHASRISDLAFSPDGSRLLSASQDRTARIWSVDGSDGPILLDGHEDWINSAEFSPDGQRVVTSSFDGTARVWRVDGSQRPFVFTGHTGPVFSAAFHPNGRRVVTASRDSTAMVWDTDGDLAPTVLRGHGDAVETAVFSPDGSSVLTSSHDETARIWRVDDTAEPLVLAAGGAPVWNASFSPDGKRVLTASTDGITRVWTLDEPGEPVELRGHSNQVWSAEFSLDGERVLTASSDMTVRIWSVHGATQPVLFKGHRAVLSTTLFSPDMGSLITSSFDSTARVWPVGRQGDVVMLAGHRAAVWEAAVSPDGQRIATASSDSTVGLWASDGSSRTLLRGHTHRVEDVNFNHDGSRLVSAGRDSTAIIWSTVGAFEPIVLRGHQDRLNHASFASNDSAVLTVGLDGTARLWPPEGGESKVLRRSPADTVRSAAFSPDGRQIVTGSEDGAVLLWDREGDSAPVQLTRYTARVTAVAFAAEGSKVIAGSRDGLARVIPLDGAGSVVELREFSAEVRQVGFSPDGSLAIVLHQGDLVRVWPADGSWDPQVLSGSSGFDFGADGERIVTGAADGGVRIWTVDVDRLQEALRASTSICLTPEFRMRSLGEVEETAIRAHAACVS